MALIKCDECGKEISDKAKQCPGCGRKVGILVKKDKQENVMVAVDKNVCKKINRPLKLEIFTLGISLICCVLVTLTLMNVKKLNNQVAGLLEANSEEKIMEIDKNMQDIVAYIEEKRSIETGGEEETDREIYTSEGVVKIGNLNVSTTEREQDGAVYCLTDAAVIEESEDGTVKVSVKGEVKTKCKYDSIGVDFKFLDANGFELKQEFVFINGTVGEFTESFSGMPNNVDCVAIN